jgi:PBCV-specific basic adaptor domain
VAVSLRRGQWISCNRIQVSSFFLEAKAPARYSCRGLAACGCDAHFFDREVGRAERFGSLRYLLFSMQNGQDEIIAYTEFADGPMRPVYKSATGGQYVIDDSGQRVYGVWIIPPDEHDTPVILDDREF